MADGFERSHPNVSTSSVFISTRCLYLGFSDPGNDDPENDAEFENEDIDKSVNFNFSQMPVVHAPAQNLGQSELSKSVIDKCTFVDKVNKIYSKNPEMKQNMLQLMEMGLTDFEACEAALQANNNNFELATSCLFM